MSASPQRSFDDLRQAAIDLLPAIEADADEAEGLYRQTDRVADAMRRTGLYSFLIPKDAGGAELPWVEAMEIVELVSRVEGSAGWCLMVNGVMGASAGPFLPDEGVEIVYPGGRNSTMAGQGVPRGYAREADGGYVIWGNWGYASGIWHADWVHSGCFLMDGDEMRTDAHGHPDIVLCHHPKDTIELTGNWDVHGLRGTGSFDYTLKQDELFVPAACCYKFDNPTQMRGGPQYGAGLVVSTTWGHTSWALGVGRRALDEIAALARQRVDAFGRMQDGAGFQHAYANAEARYRAARALVYEAWEDLSETFARDGRGSLEQIALIRLAMRHIHDVISDLSTFAHRASRGVSLRRSDLQRCYRDIHGGTQHILLADEIAQACGKVLMGAAGEDAQWNVLGLGGG